MAAAKQQEQEEQPATGVDDSRMRSLLGYNLALAGVATFGVFDRSVLAELGLKRTEYTVLVLLDANPGITSKQMGATLAIASSNMAVLVDRLHKRELLRREKSALDGRAQHLTLTAQGRALVRKAEARAVAAEQALLRRFTAGERALLFELLQRIGDERPQN